MLWTSKINTYLFSGIAFMIVFFLVVIVGLYARISFPDFMVNGEKLRMDEIIPTYVVTKFSVGVGLVIFGASPFLFFVLVPLLSGHFIVNTHHLAI